MIKFFAPEWGNTLPFDIFCARVKEAGYDGVEMALPFEAVEKRRILDVLDAHGLSLIGQYWQSVERDVDDHARQYERYLNNLIEAKPVLINCQTGKDYFTFEENKRLFDLAAKLSIESGIPIIHETHRNKALYAAHVTRQFLSGLPDLRICLDISHWCAVHESLLEDQPEAVTIALSRAVHIHSRVGHPEGPQVNDPRAPEWAAVLETHLSWWDQIVKQKHREGQRLTITTEFGPAPYMPAVPFTTMPLANQWEINVHMLGFLKNRYALKLEI